MHVSEGKREKKIGLRIKREAGQEIDLTDWLPRGRRGVCFATSQDGGSLARGLKC